MKMSRTTAATTSFSQNITTTFVPPAECTKNHLSILEDRAYQIWLNEPLPVPNSTVVSCYPPQFISSFLLQSAGTSQPAFDPLVCPENYQTVFNLSSSYIACCPSGYSLAIPSSSNDPLRPAYGGTCYSNIETVTVTAYNNQTLLGTSVWTASNPSAQAYAYPIDGFALATTTSHSSILSSFTSTPQSTSSPNSHHLPAGAIVGIAIGVVVGVAIFISSFIIIRRYRRRLGRAPTPQVRNTEPSQEEKAPEKGIDGSYKDQGIGEMHGDSMIWELDGRNRIAELEGG